MKKDSRNTPERRPPRQIDSQAPGWLLADLHPISRSSRASRLQDWKRVDRPGPTTSNGRMERWQLLVRGRVQGVGYRQACCQRARELQLNGWVRNRADGSVEVQAEGQVHQLGELRVWCEKGPAGAEVHNVVHSQLPTIHEDWFEIRR